MQLCLFTYHGYDKVLNIVDVSFFSGPMHAGTLSSATLTPCCQPFISVVLRCCRAAPMAFQAPSQCSLCAKPSGTGHAALIFSCLNVEFATLLFNS